MGSEISKIFSELDVLHGDLRRWKAREMESWIGKWGKSVMVQRIQREIENKEAELDEVLSSKRRKKKTDI
jgi:hypothetical protein